MLPAAIAVDDVRADDEHVDRQAAARVDDAADVPAAEQRRPTTPRRRVRGGRGRRESDTAALRLNVCRTSKLL